MKALLLVLVSIFVPAALAQQYPAKPVKLIVGFPAGGPADIFGRALAQGMSSELEPVETVLHGPVRDQAELHGLLDRIQALGLELIEVRRLPS